MVHGDCAGPGAFPLGRRRATQWAGGVNPCGLHDHDRCVSTVCVAAELWETFLALSATNEIKYYNSTAYVAFRGAPVALWRTPADASGRYRVSAKYLK